MPHKRVFKAEGPARSEMHVQGIGIVKVEGQLSPVHQVDEMVELQFADKLDAKLFQKP